MPKQTSSAVIVAVYKDVQALSLIIDSLLSQTYSPNEIIITEDGENEEMKAYISTLDPSKVIHLTQKDDGWRKNRALNRAVQTSKSDYLIFIDGDCVPYEKFVESHMVLSEKKHALCGRRTEPGEYFSSRLRNRTSSIKHFVNNYIINFFRLKKDNTRHYDEGIYLNPKGFIFNLIHKLGRKNSHIVGCNWSCFKEDLLLINGFDEDFTLPTTGEDTDVERRLRHFHITMKSCRNSANTIHLYHAKNFDSSITKQTEALMRTKKDIFVCKNGINK